MASLAGLLVLAGSSWALPPRAVHFGGVTPTPAVMTMTGFLTIAGQPARAGAEIAVYDPQGVLCGASGVDTANGGAFVLHVHGDDATTSDVDEGARPGDVLTFQVYDPDGTIWGQASLAFQAAPLGDPPPSYPPLFSDRASYSMVVSAANQRPVLAPIGDTSVEAGETLTFVLTAVDPEGGALSFAAVPSPPGSILADNRDGTATFRWTPGFGQAGAYRVRFTVTDDGTPPLSDAAEITITVLDVNHAPSPTAATIVTDEDTAGASQVQANDPDAGDTHTYVVSASPSNGVATVSATGLVTYVPNPDYSGPDTLTITVTDGGGATGAVTIPVTVNPVNDPPVLAEIGPQSTPETKRLNLNLTATDPDQDPLAFAVSNAPAGSKLVDLGDGRALFRWSRWRPGLYTVTFTVTDGVATDSEEVTLRLGEVNSPPVLNSIGPKVFTEGKRLHIGLTAEDPDGDPLGFHVANAPAGSGLVDHGDGTADFRWSRWRPGAYQVTFSVTDGTASASEDVTLVLGDVERPPSVPQIQSPVAGTEVDSSNPALTVAASADPDGDVVSHAFEVYADARLTELVAAGDSVFSGQGVASWTPSEELSDNRWYYWRVRAFDGAAFSEWEQGRFFVNPANDAPGPFFASSPVSGSEVGTRRPELRVTNSVDADGDTLTYAFEITRTKP